MPFSAVHGLGVCWLVMVVSLRCGFDGEDFGLTGGFAGGSQFGGDLVGHWSVSGLDGGQAATSRPYGRDIRLLAVRHGNIPDRRCSNGPMRSVRHLPVSSRSYE